MKDITISKIDASNPVLLSYIDKIKSWDKDENLMLVKEKCIVPFYALYYDAKFFGAGTIEFDKENSRVKVAIINSGLFSNKMIQTETISRFEKIINNDFKTCDVEFSYIKKRG